MQTNPPMQAKRKARSTSRLVGEEGYSDPLGFGGRFVTTTEREPGSGSIDRVTINGELYWRARLWVENSKGVRERKAICAKTEAGVLKKLAELKKAPVASRDAKKLTVAQYLDLHFLPGIKQRVRLNTYMTYERAVRNHIVPRVGKAKLVAFTSSNADAWTEELAKAGIGERATQQAFVVLKRAYAYAVRPLKMLERNPLNEHKAPAAKKKPQHIIGKAEVGRLLKAAQGTEWYVLVLLALHSSMRQGELFGLQWKYVNLPEGHLRVAEALLVGMQGEPYLGDPKTDASKRQVRLTPLLVEALKAHKAAQRDNPLGLVFPATKGGFIRKDNFRRDVWLPLVKLAGLEGVTFHSLRHAGNSMLVAGGVSMKVAQERGGWATPAAHDVYTHVMSGEADRAATKMDRILKASGGLAKGEGWVSSGVSKLKSARRKKVGTKKKTLTV